MDIKQSYEVEIGEMISLAKRRQLKHKDLINRLQIKVNDIKARHKEMKTKGKIDYETDLVMMEDNDFEEDKKYFVDEDNMEDDELN